MPLRFTIALLVAAGATSGPALACMGPTVIFADNFQTEDPAWGAMTGTLSIAGGYAALTPHVGDYAAASYGGAFVDNGDACVDVMSPAVAAPAQAAGGILFGMTDLDNFYVFAAEEDGQAAIYQRRDGAWNTPVAWRPAPALKSGGNVTNTLRITWNGTTGAAYINGQTFATFTIQPFKNTKFGIWCEGDPAVNPTSGATFQFSNLKITNP
jgi:hypothetical protein